MLFLLMNRKIRTSKKIVGKKLGGEWVFLNFQNGQYYGLNKTGSLIWDSLVRNKSLETILEILQKKFSVEQTRLDREIHEFLDNLQKEGLIEIEDSVQKT